MRNVTKICMLATLVLALSLSGAMGQFGSKVFSGDMDEGHLLGNFALPGQIPIQVGYWDIGPNQGLPDEGDVVYLHFGLTAFGPVTVNDIRLTPFGIYGAGSKVAAADNDVGKAIAPLTTRICFADVGGVIGSYDFMDTVYVIRPPFATTKTGDIRLTPVGALPAGSIVRDFDLDNNRPVILLTVIPPPPGASPTIRFYNENGNVAAGGIPIYDVHDDVYLATAPPAGVFGFVTPNDIRLSN